jgi:hypothetical protein
MTKVRLIRLANGDELIADFESSFIKDNLNFIRIKNVLSVHKNEKSDIVLVSYNPFSSSNIVEIESRHVMNITDVHAEIERYYSNSLICNKKFLDDQLIERVKMTNEEIEQQLSILANTPTPQESEGVSIDKVSLLRLKPASSALN